MSFHTESLPDPIRTQAEEYIRYLLWKQSQVLEGQPITPQPAQLDMETFLARWTGIVPHVEDNEDAKLDYLSQKYL